MKELTMGDTSRQVLAEAKAKAKKAPPKKWRNRYRVGPRSGTVECDFCKTLVNVNAHQLLETHCHFYPSKDIAETEGQTCEAVFFGDIEYLCAFPIEESH